ncbi:MAG TPA: glycosyltransferase [Gemmatimonadales bacterium]
MSPERTIAYLVKAWPRLSETFILNEIVSLERRGVPIRIFSTKVADTGPAHAEIAQVRAEVTYLALRQHWKQAALANLRGLGREPRRYLQVLFEVTERAIRQRRFAPLKHFFKAAYLADILRYKPADHLHAHFASAPTMVAMFTHQLCGIPYSFTAHAKDIYVAPPAVSKLERARAVVTCTLYNRRFLMDQFGTLCDGKVHCIYHGLDTSRFRFSLSGRADSGEPLILSVARLVEKKGLADLITAAAMLRDRGRSFRLQIVGDGPLRHVLEAQVKRLGLGGRVALPGAQSHDLVRRAYQRAAVFALPCVIASNGDRDGIPNVLLEAMASGVPVISTPVSGIPELIESGVDGLLVPPNSPPRLAETLDLLLASQGLRERLACAARAKIESSFSLETSAERLLAVFALVTGESPSDGRPSLGLAGSGRVSWTGARVQ